jgi:hypothetical protein
VQVIPLPYLLALAVKLIRQAPQEKHPEDELLEFGGVHLAAQNIGGLEQE